jgi:hypothetical protein
MPSSGYVVMGANNFAQEIASYSSIAGAVISGMVRGICNGGTGTSQANGNYVMLIASAQWTCGVNGNNNINHLKLWKGGEYFQIGLSLLTAGNPLTESMTSGVGWLIGPLSASNITGTTYATTNVCGAVGTAASPSVAACGAAPAGAFSCATNASAATCTVNTTIVTATSQIFVNLVADEGTRLGVTCNITPSSVPANIVATKTAGTGFTINMPTITTNPQCFNYLIVN